MDRMDVIIDSINQISRYKCNYKRETHTLKIINYAYLIKIEFFNINDVTVTHRWKYGLLGQLIFSGSFEDMKSLKSVVKNVLKENDLNIQDIVLLK